MPFQRVLDQYSDASCVAIDIPIGLPQGQPRHCDLQARAVLGPRRNSVFPAPDRRLLDASHYGEALARSRLITGKGISKQTFAISHKIADVDRLMTPELQVRVVEIHPEVCFWAMAGRRPMAHHKATPEGFEERRALLLRAYEGVQIPNLYEAASLVPPAKSDDVFDAMAAAWTASHFAQRLASRFPANPPTDTRGLRMEIVF
ncbi:MAG: DUF429 domain-containing protein [Acidobacteria bacterium]|nr:DUF429 domain-containing protein [Acidobacteriota bacterium]